MNPLLFLRVYRDNELITVKQFPDDQIVMGQSPDTTLQLDGPGIALVHAMIENRNGQHYICDLGSEGGTKLNGQPILDHTLQSGDEVQIGPFKIEFHIGLPKPKSTPPGAKPPPVEAPKAKPPPPSVSKPKVDFPTAPGSGGPRPADKPRPSVVTSTSGGLGTFEEVTKTQKRKIVERAGHGTYAPPPQHRDVYEYAKASKGNLIEVMVTWGERLVNTYQYEKPGTVNVGSHPKNAIVLPVFGSGAVSHPLIKIDSMATIYLTNAMTVEITKEKDPHRYTQEELRADNRLAPTGTGTALALQQGEMAKIDFGHELCIIVRYTTSGGKPIAAPFLDFSSSELVGLVTILAISAILGLYLLIYSPDEKPEEEELAVEHKAVFMVPKRERVQVDVSDMEQGIKQPTTQEKKKPQTAAEGAASEAAPNKSKSAEVKPTTPNPGNATGIKKGSLTKAQKTPTKEASGSTGPKAKDVTKTGLLSVFGNAGTQAAMRNADRGAGLAGGMGANAAGAGADVARGAGTVEGLGTKDLGKGGAGESTVGISGVKTKGRGGGVQGYGAGNLGDKGRAAVTVGGEGESFTGTIDKEGIRRVVRANQREIQACYEKALNQDPGLSGKVVLEWEIGDRGRVGKVRVLNSSLGNRSVENCMMSALKRWTFPEPPPDQIAVVAFPFVFMSQQ